MNPSRLLFLLGWLGTVLTCLADTPQPGFDELLYVERINYQSNHFYTDYINGGFFPGGNLCVLNLKTGQKREVVKDLTGGIFGRFDLSFDAKRVVFAWKRSKDEGYRIFECGIDGSNLKQLTFPPENEAELVEKYRVTPAYHHGTDDMDPCYLPDGGICFISTRCQYGILCDVPDNFTTTVLYRMNQDGSNMQKLTNSSVSEMTPTVTNDGRILYTRWEYVDKGASCVKCLWAMNPDGTNSVEIFGNDIALPPTFTQGRPIPDASNLFVACGTPHYPHNAVGTVIRIDISKNTRTREPMTYITPDVDIRAEGGFWFDPEGKWGKRLFKDPYPLSQNLFLVSMNPTGDFREKVQWEICLLDETGNTTPVTSNPQLGCFEPMPLRPRRKPPVIASTTNPELAKQGMAACIVTDIYQGMEGIARGTAKYIRINEQVPRPWSARRNPNDDRHGQQHVVISKYSNLGLKVQHGIVPIEPDGSAYFLVPADRNIYFQVLDENFMELQRERTFINYRPGENRSCIGCHETSNRVQTAQPRKLMALKRAPSLPGPQPGETSGSRPLNYASDVQPILDKHCVQCHGEAEPAANLNLTGTLTQFFSESYENLMPDLAKKTDRGLLGKIIGELHPKVGNAEYLPAKSLGSHTSVLVAMLSKGKVQLADPAAAERAGKLAKRHAHVQLSPEELVRITTWIESNGQYYGSYFGKRNLIYKDQPDFRPLPTFQEATRQK